MSGPKYTNRAQQRVLTALTAMAGNEVFGITTGELAKKLRTSASNVTRDMANLTEAGLAEQMESGAWRLTPRMAQIALTVLNNLDRARSQVEETHQRYTRTR